MAMKVGIAVPCHINDIRLLNVCLSSISKLDPQPFDVSIDVNKGEKTLREIRAGLFDSLFDEGCDVVLQCSCDFSLFPHILKYVSETKVVTFTPLAKRFYDLTLAAHRLLLPKTTWTGCYSLPKKIWFETVKPSFDGYDSSVSKAVKKWKVKSFQYYLLRPYQKKTTRISLAAYPLWKRLVWQLLRFKAVKLRG